MKKFGSIFILCLFVFVSCSKAPVEQQPVTAKQKPKVDVESALAKGMFQIYTDYSGLKMHIVKDGSITVNANMLFTSGSLDISSATPSLSLGINVTSFNTAVSMRDVRVKEIFFEVSKAAFKTATFQVAVLPADVIAKLKNDKKVDGFTVTGTLGLHGVTIPVTAVLNAAFDDSGALVVTSDQPLVIKISDLGMNDQLTSLKTACGHQDVKDEVTLDVHVEFAPK